MTMNIFCEPDLSLKLAHLEEHVHLALKGQSLFVPDFSSRDVKVLDLKHHPDKKGLSTSEGKARLLHDLASIELQAMELALRSLSEYPEADEAFRQELADLTLSEARHLRLCIKGIEDLGYKWGDWPVHLALWNSVSKKDTLLERIFIVHRYLEGSGLDAADTLLRRLYGMGKSLTTEVIQTITDEEVDHVKFGSLWFHKMCQSLNKDADIEFKLMISNLRGRLPKRVEPINYDLRKKSAFTDSEIEQLNILRESYLVKLPQ